MATSPRDMLTYDDYLHFPEGQRWELLNGEAHMAPAPNIRHQLIADTLIRWVLNHLEEHGGGLAISAPCDVVLTHTDVVQPDLVFLADQDLDRLTEDNIRGTPTWVVEVLSHAKRDREVKRQIYERTGIPEYWIVDPGPDTVEILLLRDGTYPDQPIVLTAPQVATPVALPGFEVDLARLFNR